LRQVLIQGSPATFRGVPTELVIFDCDGVLVDSEVPSNQVLRDVVAELGWPLTLGETMERFKGWALSDIWSEVEARLGVTVTPEVERSFRARQLELLAARVQPVDGVRETLQALSVPCCVASNGPHEKMHVTLGATGLLAHFEGRLFSRLDVSRGKPHPDLFLHAAHALGTLPERCLVVEDSPLGIEAAHRAGMSAVGFAGTSTADARALAEAGAGRVMRHMTELLSVLGPGLGMR